MNVTHTTVADLGEGWTPQGWTIALACGHVTDGVAHMQFSIGDSMICTEEHPSETVEAPQDHGPLAAPLSDRTLAKVLSRPAHVPPGELRERSEVEERVLKASLAWQNADTDDFDALRDTFWAMKDAIADYAKAVQS